MQPVIIKTAILSGQLLDRSIDRSLCIVLSMATRLTTCHHPYHHRFSTISADGEPVDDSSGAEFIHVCPACGKVSTLQSCMHI